MLEDRFRRLDKKLRGKLGICVEFLDTGERFGLRADKVFPTASVIKTQILAVLMERAKAGKVDLDKTRKLRKSDKVGGSGVLKHMTVGTELTIRDLGTLMMILSDNTATNMVIDVLGIDRINAQLREWGYQKTELYRKITFDIAMRHPKWLAVTTPEETADLLARIARHKLLGPKWDKELERVLGWQKYDTALPRKLPGAGSWSDEKPEFEVAHKTGSIEGVRNDVGIVTSPAGRYVISVFTKELKDDRYHPDNEGILAIAEVSRVVYDSLHKKRRKS